MAFELSSVVPWGRSLEEYKNLGPTITDIIPKPKICWVTGTVLNGIGIES